MNPHELKALQSRLREAEAERDSCEERSNRALEAFRGAIARVDSIKSQIREIEDAAKEPIVTEHALLRYIERFMNVNLEEVRKAILTEQAVKLIKFTKTGKVTTDGRRLVVKNGTVVTVEPTEREAA
jgi:hypothetical protein